MNNKREQLEKLIDLTNNQYNMKYPIFLRKGNKYELMLIKNIEFTKYNKNNYLVLLIEKGTLDECFRALMVIKAILELNFEGVGFFRKERSLSEYREI